VDMKQRAANIFLELYIMNWHYKKLRYCSGVIPLEKLENNSTLIDSVRKLK